MKSLRISLVILGAIALAGAGSSKSRFEGEISDTQCAMNVHSLNRSHEEMITKRTMGTDAASCAQACVRRGGEWVLRSGNEVYRLNKQEGMENFAGQKVAITGTLDTRTNTIDNTNIEAASMARNKR